MEKIDEKLLQEIEGDTRTAMLYAYRYLLNREPEDMYWVTGNTKSWQELRREFISGDEYILGETSCLA